MNKVNEATESWIKWLQQEEAILNIRILKSYPKEVKYLKLRTQLIQLKSLSEFYSC